MQPIELVLYWKGDIDINFIGGHKCAENAFVINKLVVLFD